MTTDTIAIPVLPDSGEVLIVASQQRAAQLTDALRDARLDSAVRASIIEDHLMALGHAAQVRPAMVLASTSAMNGEAAATGVALRRLLPTATLVLVGPAQRSGDYRSALEAGFDAYLSEPVDGGELRAAVRAAEERRNTAANRAARPVRTRDRQSGSHPEGARPDAITPSGQMGDVDLVDQIMRDPAHLPQAAVRLIAEQSQMQEVGWSRTGEGVPAEHAQVPIVLSDNPYGYLHARKPVEERELLRWADWLSHWMAMQQHVLDLWQLALRDDLTGVWNRRYFMRFLGNILQRAAQERFRVTVLVFDIDDFKLYNDRYGHPAGDEILRETARLMQSVVRDHDIVARIGGDEFAVIFWDADAPREPNSEHPHNVRRATERFQRALCSHRFPKLVEEARDTLTISAGLAGFPWDGRTPDELLAKADEMAMQSKRQGKDAVTFGPGALYSEDCRSPHAPHSPGQSGEPAPQ